MAYRELSVGSEKALEKANADLDQGDDRPSRVGAAIALWVDGAPLSEIAELLGYSNPTQARQAIEKGLSSLADDDGKEKARFKANRRLERMLRPLWKRIEDPDDPDNLPAIRAGLSITDRIIRLNGADAAQEMIVYNPSTAELDAWLAERARQIRGHVPDEVDIIEGYVVDDTGEGDSDD
jgi:hypothetical protein